MQFFWGLKLVIPPYLDDERLQLVLHQIKGNLVCEQHVILHTTNSSVDKSVPQHGRQTTAQRTGSDEIARRYATNVSLLAGTPKSPIKNLLDTTTTMPSTPTGWPCRGRLLCAPLAPQLPPAYPAAVNELVEDLGHAWCVIQEHQALADHCVIRLWTVLIQADQQLQHLWGDIDHTHKWLPFAYTALLPSRTCR